MGEPFIVTDEKEAAAAAAKFREYIQTPVLTGQSLSAQLASKRTTFTQLICPTDGATTSDSCSASGVVQLAGMFELSGTTGRGDYVTRFDVSTVQPEEANRAVRYLWARNRIAELS
jgi:Ca-activated chloride channel family protein